MLLERLREPDRSIREVIFTLNSSCASPRAVGRRRRCPDPIPITQAGREVYGFDPAACEDAGAGGGPKRRLVNLTYQAADCTWMM